MMRPPGFPISSIPCSTSMAAPFAGARSPWLARWGAAGYPDEALARRIEPKDPDGPSDTRVLRCEVPPSPERRSASASGWS
jgi:hypothetical protein